MRVSESSFVDVAMINMAILRSSSGPQSRLVTKYVLVVWSSKATSWNWSASPCMFSVVVVMLATIQKIAHTTYGWLLSHEWGHPSIHTFWVFERPKTEIAHLMSITKTNTQARQKPTLDDNALKCTPGSLSSKSPCTVKNQEDEHLQQGHGCILLDS